MKKGKVGCTPNFTGPSDPTERVSPFQTGLVAPEGFVIDCELYRWCLLCPVLTGTDAVHGFLYKVWGSQTSGSLGQTIDFVFNYEIIRAQAGRVSSVIAPQDGAEIAAGRNTVGLVGNNIFDTYSGTNVGFDNTRFGKSGVAIDQIDTITEQEGGSEDYHSVIHFSRLQNSPSAGGYQDIRANTLASSADLPAGNAVKNYIINPQLESESFALDSDKAPWLAVPCGMFNFLQLQIISVTTTNECAIAYSLIG